MACPGRQMAGLALRAEDLWDDAEGIAAGPGGCPGVPASPGDVPGLRGCSGMALAVAQPSPPASCRAALLPSRFVQAQVQRGAALPPLLHGTGSSNAHP